MNISSLNEIKNDSIILYYKLPMHKEYNLWVGDKQNAERVAELIQSAYDADSGLILYRGLFTNEEKTELYLLLTEGNNEIGMHHGTWKEVSAIRSDSLFDAATFIPLFEIKNKQEEVINMTQVKNTVTGASIVTTAKTGELFATVAKPTVIVKKDEQGILIYNDSKEGVIIDNHFLAEVFTPYVENVQAERNYLPLEEALNLFANEEKHIHVDIFLPSGEVHETICLNQFLLIAEAVYEVKQESPIEMLKFMASFSNAASKKDEDALELINPLKARIPVEVLLYGKFFIKEEVEETTPSLFN